MTQRSFDDAFWGDDFVQALDSLSKLLFAYLWTNESCNSAALYHITLKTISFDTGIPEKELPDLFNKIEKKVAWYPQENIVWVKNFVRRQPKSPQYMTAVAKCIDKFGNNGLVKEFVDYNNSLGVSIPYDYIRHTISIPYPYGINQAQNTSKEDTVSIPHPYPLDDDKDNDGDKDIDKGVQGETKRLNIFKIYEDNIGLITPMVAEQLKDVENTYSVEWFKEAVKEAINHNVRKLSYILRILDNWSVNGFKSSKKKENTSHKRYNRAN